MNVLLCTLLFAQVSFAASEEKEAERVRISDDMERFSKRGNWKAVEKKYEELLGLGLDVPFADHLLGAQAIFYLGDVKRTCATLELAISIAENNPELEEQKSSALAWLTDIYSVFFPVEITVSRSYKEDASLEIAELPFMPEEQDVYKQAKEILAEDGRFKGMLPAGEYKIAGQSFVLPEAAMTPGQPNEPHIVKVQDQNSAITIAPRLDLGSALSKAGQLKETSALNADAFGGVGARAGAGFEVGMGTNVGIFTEIGYHRISKDEEIPLQMQNLGFKPTNTDYNSFFVWSGARYKLNDLSVLGGLTLDRATATTQGADQQSDARLDLATAQYLSLEGTIVAAGFAGGVSYSLMEFGPLTGGLSLLLGAQNDSARWYSWGQLALTISPS